MRIFITFLLIWNDNNNNKTFIHRFIATIVQNLTDLTLPIKSESVEKHKTTVICVLYIWEGLLRINVLKADLIKKCNITLKSELVHEN